MTIKNLLWTLKFGGLTTSRNTVRKIQDR